MAYEKKVVKELKRRFGELLTYHQWIEFYDGKGKGWCEPELYLLGAEIILMEVKLTGGPHGKAQMEHLYKPLLEKIFNRRVRCLLICKYKTDETPGPMVGSVDEFIAGGESFATLHWLI